MAELTLCRQNHTLWTKCNDNCLKALKGEQSRADCEQRKVDEGTSMEGASIFMALAGKQAANGVTRVAKALIENWHLSGPKMGWDVKINPHEGESWGRGAPQVCEL